MKKVTKIDFKKCQHELMIAKLLEEGIRVAYEAINEGPCFDDVSDIEACFEKYDKKGLGEEFKSLLVLNTATCKLHSMMNDAIRLLAGVDLHAVNWAAYGMMQYVSEDIQDKSLDIFGHPPSDG